MYRLNTLNAELTAEEVSHGHMDEDNYIARWASRYYHDDKVLSIAADKINAVEVYDVYPATSDTLHERVITYGKGDLLDSHSYFDVTPTACQIISRGCEIFNHVLKHLDTVLTNAAVVDRETFLLLRHQMRVITFGWAFELDNFRSGPDYYEYYLGYSIINSFPKSLRKLAQKAHSIMGDDVLVPFVLSHLSREVKCYSLSQKWDFVKDLYFQHGAVFNIPETPYHNVLAAGRLAPTNIRACYDEIQDCQGWRAFKFSNEFEMNSFLVRKLVDLVEFIDKHDLLCVRDYKEATLYNSSYVTIFTDVVGEIYVNAMAMAIALNLSNWWNTKDRTAEVDLVDQLEQWDVDTEFDEQEYKPKSEILKFAEMKQQLRSGTRATHKVCKRPSDAGKDR